MNFEMGSCLPHLLVQTEAVMNQKLYTCLMFYAHGSSLAYFVCNPATYVYPLSFYGAFYLLWCLS